MAEHSKLPWKVTSDERGQIIRATDDTGRPIASMWLNGDDPKANAALIIKACNNFDALVAALREVVEARMPGQARSIARAALALIIDRSTEGE